MEGHEQNHTHIGILSGQFLYTGYQKNVRKTRGDQSETYRYGPWGSTGYDEGTRVDGHGKPKSLHPGGSPNVQLVG